MKNNKGFIATSLIYSFFLIFLVTLLATVTEYAKNRVLLNDVKKETQKYLDGITGFNPVDTELRDYEIGEEITFGSDKWLVIVNEADKIEVILNRSLTEDEILNGLDSSSITPSVKFSNMTLLCQNTYTPLLCSYKDQYTYNPYKWNNSIVKNVLDVWLNNNATLQKAISLNRLYNMTFTDNSGVNITSYIRIPISSESALINSVGLNAANMWHLTKNGDMNVIINGVNTATYNVYKEIYPIITINKPSES